MYDYLNELNESQRQAVENTDGATLVIAGAGSGKTRVLTYRIAHLLRLGKQPSRILALTFTNKAAREMKDRIAKVVGEQSARYLWMGTFHSIFAKILRIEAEQLGYPSNFTIYDSTDSKNVIKAIIKDLKLDDKRYKPNTVASRISAAKNNLITYKAYLSNATMMGDDRSANLPEIGKIYQMYAERCFKAGAMDFDDLLLQTNVLFRDFKDTLRKYQERFDYILVDEYQDTNYAQYLIIKKLSEIHQNICVVGDDSQSIYSFRGAKIENILNFQREYPNNKLIKLEQNYRSTKNIVEVANTIIKKNSNRIPKKVFTDNEDGNKIRVIECLTDQEEGYSIANQIFDLRVMQHFDFMDFAILYRTNAQSRIFEEALRRRNIPYKIYGGMSFYDRKEIKDMLSYFRLVVNNKDDEALKRVINYPKRGIGDTTLLKIEQLAAEQQVSIWQVITNFPTYQVELSSSVRAKIAEFVFLIRDCMERMKNSTAYDVAKQIASVSGILKDLHSEKTPEGLSRHENVQELLNGIKEFSMQEDIENEELTLSKYLEEVCLLTTGDGDSEEDKNKVTLMSIHSAKGLEFKNVFIVGVEEGLFPSQMSAFSLQEIEEERRLFYVAVTRAEKNLSISFARSRMRWGEFKNGEPSRFIREMDARYLHLPKSLQDTAYISIDNEDSKPLTTTNRINPNPIRPISDNNRVVTTNSNFKADHPSKIVVGIRVEHERFGYGKVLQLEGDLPNTKATIAFEKAGTKQLLLKFAKLKVI